MAGAVHLVHPVIAAERAGYTGGAPHLVEPVSSVFESVPGMGQLTEALAGGIHPEHVPVPSAVPLERATDSVVGRLGGLVPRSSGTQAAGPAGTAATTLERLIGPPRSAWDRLRAQFVRPSTGARHG